MDETTKVQDSSGVDKGLVAMFLKMSPEERLMSNDNAVRTILELRNAYQQQKNKNHRSEEDLLQYTVEIDFRGYTLRVLDMKKLIELKKTSRDPKDKQRLPVLEETLRQLEKQ